MSFVIREPYGELTEKIKRLFEECIAHRDPPENIWLTDTVYCGRKKIYSMMGFGPRFDEESLSRIWLGIVVGKALEEIGIAREVRVEYGGVAGRIDTLLETGEPLEIKVVSSPYVVASEYSKAHVEQLSRYCLAVGKCTGVLLYYIPSVRISALPAYRFKFDLEEVKAVTDERIRLLRRAADMKDPTILPATWHSNNMSNWECRKCSYRPICANMGVTL